MSKRSEAVAKALGARPSIVMAEWMAGVAEHLIGSQAAAIRHGESATTPGPVPRWARSSNAFDGTRGRVAIANIPSSARFQSPTRRIGIGSGKTNPFDLLVPRKSIALW
jgi:hypothetical protein